MRSKRRLLLYVPCTIIALAIVSLLLFTFLIDLNNYKEFFVKKMEAALHRPVSIGKVEAVLYKGFQIRFQDFAVKGEGGQPDILTARHLDIRFHPLSILKRRIFISKIELQSPTFFMVRNARGKGDARNGESGFAKIPAIDSRDMELLVKNFSVYQGRFVFVDRATGDGSVTLELRDANLLVENLFWSDPPSLRLTGILSRRYYGGHDTNVNIRLQFLRHPMEVPLKEVEFSASVKLSNLNLTDYLPYYRRWGYLSNFYAALDADLALVGSAAGGFRAEGSVSFQPLRVHFPAWYDQSLSPEKASALFRVSLDENSIRFSDLTINWDAIQLSGSLLLENYRSSDTMEVSAEFSSLPFKLRDIRGYLPVGKLPPSVARFLDSITYAQTRVTGVQIKGSLQDLRKWGKADSRALVKGSVTLTDMDVMVGEAKLPFNGLDLILSLGDGDLDFEITRGRFKNSRIKAVQGKVVNVFGEPLLMARVSAAADLADLRELISLKGGSDIPGFLSRVENLYGKGNLTLNLARRLPHGSTSLEGEIDLSGAFVSHPQLPLPLADVEGKVRFSNDSFGFRELQGFFGTSPFRVRLASYNFREESPALLLQGSVSLNHTDLVDLLPTRVRDKLDLSGSTAVVLSLTGTSRSIDIQAEFDLHGFSYRYNNFYKPLSADGRLEFKAHLTPSHMLTVKELSITHGEMKATLKGDIFNLHDPVVDVQLQSSNFDVRHLSELFPGLLAYNPRGGRSSIQFNFTGSPQTLKTQGTVWVEEVAADFGSLPLLFANGKVTYRDGVFRWEVDRATTGKTRFYTRGSYRSKPRKRLSMVFKFASLYLKDLQNRPGRDAESGGDGNGQFSAAEEKANLPPEEKGWRQGRDRVFGYPFSATIEAENLFIRGVRLWGLSTRLESRDGLWAFNDLKFNLAEGKFRGRLVVNGLSPSGSEFVMETDLIGVDLAKLIHQVDPETDIISGTLSLKSKIWGDRLDLEGIRKSVSGKLDVRIDNGSIRKFKILATISSLLNLPQLLVSGSREQLGQGLPYRTITGGLKFKKGVMYTEDLFVDGPSARMSAVGSVDFAAKKYDMTVALQPLGDLGGIVSKIPLVGRLIAGSDESITTAFFEVGGEFRKPEVKFIQHKALADILRRKLEDGFGLIPDKSRKKR